VAAGKFNTTEGTGDGAMEGEAVSAEKYREAMRAEVERVLDAVAAAVNAAPDGAWIRGSEEKVRDLMADFRRVAFEKALQMRVDAAEASFSPSEGPCDGPTGAQPRPAEPRLDDRQRSGRAAASLAAEGRRAGPRRRRRPA
jgi:hypothetical protein